MLEFALRNDVYRRPLMTALDRLGLREGWRCVDVGAGGGDVSVALAEVVGRDGRVYAVDSDPLARDLVAAAAAAAPGPGGRHHPGGGGPAPARAGRPRLLPVRPHARPRPGGGARPHGRGGPARGMGGGPGADHVGRPGRRAAPVDARRPPPRRRAPTSPPWPWPPGWRSSTPGPSRRPAPARARWPTTWPRLTGVHPGDDAVVLPPLVTVVARRPVH